jgi:hypothetical protein
VFDSHNSSKKHRLNVELRNNTNSNENKIYCCNKCHKNYTTNSGLWRHKKTCEQKPPPPPENISLLERITHLENKVIELENSVVQSVSGEIIPNTNVQNVQNSTVVTAPNSNNTNNIYINYLNTNCKDAMNIKDFVDSMVFTKDDMLKFLTDHYDIVLAKLVTERLEQLPSTQRPLYCITSTVDTSKAFAVKTTEWKQEERDELTTHIRDVEDDDEYLRMTMPQTIDNIKDKVFDTYEEERKAEPKLERIRNKMCGGSGTEGKIRVLDNLLQKDALQMPKVARGFQPLHY